MHKQNALHSTVSNKEKFTHLNATDSRYVNGNTATQKKPACSTVQEDWLRWCPHVCMLCNSHTSSYRCSLSTRVVIFILYLILNMSGTYHKGQQSPTKTHKQMAPATQCFSHKAGGSTHAKGNQFRSSEGTRGANLHMAYAYGHEKKHMGRTNRWQPLFTLKKNRKLRHATSNLLASLIWYYLWC